MTSARLTAARVLVALIPGRTTLAAELERARGALEDRRDRGLLVELATGVLRWQAELDAVITGASRRTIADVDPLALVVLRLGVYQLRHLERVPDHAIVHESVEVVRAIGAPRAAGFVNAVLRTVIRGGGSAALPIRPPPGSSDEAWVRYLSIALSHPAWLVRRWLTSYGSEATEVWCQFNNTPPEIVMRPLGSLTPQELLHRLHDEGAEAAPARFVRDAVCLPPGWLGRLSQPLIDRILVQDESSQLVARAAGARPGERVLDACASPGGKTVVLANDLAGALATAPSQLVAADFRPARVSLLARTIRRAGLDVAVARFDARRSLPFGPVFDCVLLDAPCSGLGTLRRDPDLKWTRQERDLATFAADQRLMLAAAADVVRPGGRLVYATCSSEPEENADVVQAFLETDRRFALMPPAEAAVPKGLLDERGCLATQPFRDGLEAFFAAVLVRRQST